MFLPSGLNPCSWLSSDKWINVRAFVPQDSAGGSGGRRKRDSKEVKLGPDGLPLGELEERVVQVKRVTKVTKGGKLLNFRAVVVVGDKKGIIGVGCAKSKEVAGAVAKAVVDAEKNLVKFSLTKEKSIPHTMKVKGDGGAKLELFPAGNGTGVIAGGAARIVLELAGVQNCFAKQRGSGNPLNNARATSQALAMMRTPKQFAEVRGYGSVEDFFDPFKEATVAA